MKNLFSAMSRTRNENLIFARKGGKNDKTMKNKFSVTKPGFTLVEILVVLILAKKYKLM